MARFAGIRSKRARVPHRWKPSTWRLRTTSFVINRTMSSRKPSRRLIRSEEHTSELQSQSNLVCRLLLEKKKQPHSNLPPSFCLFSATSAAATAFLCLPPPCRFSLLHSSCLSPSSCPHAYPASSDVLPLF